MSSSDLILDMAGADLEPGDILVTRAQVVADYWRAIATRIRSSAET